MLHSTVVPTSPTSPSGFGVGGFARGPGPMQLHAKRGSGQVRCGLCKIVHMFIRHMYLSDSSRKSCDVINPIFLMSKFGMRFEVALEMSFSSCDAKTYPIVLQVVDTELRYGQRTGGVQMRKVTSMDKIKRHVSNVKNGYSNGGGGEDNMYEREPLLTNPASQGVIGGESRYSKRRERNLIRR